MKLRHATKVSNIPSILRQGLLTSKAKGKLRAIWLHSPSATAWAVLHTIKLHRCKPDSVVVLELTVPRTLVRRSNGHYFVKRDIPAARISGIVNYSEQLRDHLSA
jgi:hypothetical protein